MCVLDVAHLSRCLSAQCANDSSDCSLVQDTEATIDSAINNVEAQLCSMDTVRCGSQPRTV